MDIPFVYDRSVTNRNFLGRKPECNALANLLSCGEHIVIYGRPKSGKMSLVQQSLFNLKMTGKHFMAAQISLSNVRTLETFLLKFGTGIIKAVCSTADEYSSVVEKYLPDTHFVFDRSRFAEFDEVVSLNWAPDMNDFAAVLRLPAQLAKERGVPYFVIVEDFQNMMSMDEYEDAFKVMEQILKEKSPEASASFVLTGSQVNAMKLIFEERKFFYKIVENIPLSEIDDKEIIEYMVKGFMVTGKVIEKDLALGACKLFRNDMWYINHFSAICDKMTRGYVTEPILMDALNIIISIHEPYFYSIVNDLTNHQISLLRAVLDGVIKFSASEVIEKYSLNSSANVRRVKDALKKKEVLTFNDRDEPVILDPLFEYWLEKHYFERR